MYIMSAKSVNEMLKKDSHLDKKMLANMHIERVEFYRENKNTQLSDDHLSQAIEFINDELNILLTKEQFIEIMDCFPYDKILYIESEDTSDVLTPVYSFIAGCAAPTYGDKVDMEKFSEYVLEQAKKLGYHTTI